MSTNFGLKMEKSCR